VRPLPDIDAVCVESEDSDSVRVCVLVGSNSIEGDPTNVFVVVSDKEY